MRIGEVLERFHKWRGRFDVYLVGGIVRDLLLYGEGYRIKDCDVVLIGDRGILRKFVDLLIEEGGQLNRFSRFGTAELLYRGMNLDVALARRERYAYPGALPDVEFTDDLYEDSLRRDFTVNALYHDGKDILDFHGGVEDLKNGLLRPLASFEDDPTRGLRGVRYRHKLGFSYHETFYNAVKDAARYISNVSPQRILNELRLTAELPRKVFLGAVKDAVRFNLLRTILKVKPRFPEKIYLGRPNSARWIIPLTPFLRENLPLTKEERRVLRVKEPLNLKTISDIHFRMNRWSDLEILAYMTWYATEREREILKVYTRIRDRVRIRMYPKRERIKSAIASMHALGISGDVPMECTEEPPTPKDRQTYKLRCEGKIMEMYLSKLHR